MRELGENLATAEMSAGVARPVPEGNPGTRNSTRAKATRPPAKARPGWPATSAGEGSQDIAAVRYRAAGHRINYNIAHGEAPAAGRGVRAEARRGARHGRRTTGWWAPPRRGVGGTGFD